MENPSIDWRSAPPELKVINPGPRPVSRDLPARYRVIRKQSEVICDPLHVDDFNLQGMPDSSPPKWHLAHTTWFFETFVLAPFVNHYQYYNQHFVSLFNSYYTATESAAFPRPQRGLLTRPTTSEIYSYRNAIDQKVCLLLDYVTNSGDPQCEAIFQRIELGLQHEQQHQELLLTDIKYGFSLNPMFPTFCERNELAVPRRIAPPLARKLNWLAFDERLCDIGIEDTSEFHFDNEGPRHAVMVHAFALADRPITNREYLEFIDDGGYRRPEFWLADGWFQVRQQQWQAPLYWRTEGDQWRLFTLHGEVPLALDEPVCHVSYYEADAFARWAGARLPTEAEWERVAAPQPIEGHFIDDGVLHPRAACDHKKQLHQLYGDVWEWTASSYAPYPGYEIPGGAIGEYNGKFMCNQMVLRGGSCVSSRGHLRASYRNFFYPADRWQFSGIRLARSLK